MASANLLGSRVSSIPIRGQRVSDDSDFAKSGMHRRNWLRRCLDSQNCGARVVLLLWSPVISWTHSGSTLGHARLRVFKEVSTTSDERHHQLVSPSIID